MKLTFKNETFTLDTDPAEVGYAAERFEALTFQGKKVTIGGHTGKTQVIIALPSTDCPQYKQVEELDKNVTGGDLADLWLIFSGQEGNLEAATLNHFISAVPADDVFAEEYGVLAGEGPLAGRMVPTVFVVSKEGTLFYREIPADLDNPFDEKKFHGTIGKALAVYTGVGCEDI